MAGVTTQSWLIKRTLILLRCPFKSDILKASEYLKKSITLFSSGLDLLSCYSWRKAEVKPEVAVSSPLLYNFL